MKYFVCGRVVWFLNPIVMETPQRNKVERGVGMESGTELNAGCGFIF